MSGDTDEGVNPFSTFLDGEIEMEELQQQVAGLDFSDTPSQPIDSRLMGNWRHTRVMSGGGMSYISERYLSLAGDGTFVASSRGMASSTFVDSFGNWAGVGSIDSGVGPGDRGTWSVVAGVFRLDYADETYSSCQYEITGSEFLCYRSGENELWKRA